MAEVNIEEKRAMDLAEESREKQWNHPSFVAELFKGNFKWNLLHPFSEQSQEDKLKGDEFIKKVKDILTKYFDPEKIDEERKLPKDGLDALKKIGCYGMKIPKKYGGLELSNMNYTRVISMVSSYCASTAVLLSAHQSIGVPQPLKMFGTDEQKEKFLPRIAAGALSAFALTEPNVGSDPAKMETTAVLSDDGKYYTINGTKLWCTNGTEAELIILMALTKAKIVKGKEKAQISAFVIDTATPGMTIENLCSFMGLSGIMNGVLKFKDFKVPAENIISKEGDGLKIALVTLNSGRLAIPVCSSAAGKKCMSISKKWANNRVQWGKPIGQHQSVSKFLANMTTDTFAMESMSLASVFMADNSNADIRLEAAMSKYFCSEVASRIADDTLQIKGGRGYERSSSLRARGEDPDPIERLIRDLRINRIIEGSSEIMRLFIAREAVDMHFSIAMPFLKAKSFSSKISLGFKMMLFYSLWLPKQYVPRFKSFNTKNLDPKNKSYLNFISSTSRKMARRLFLSMAKYQIKLQDEQVLLGNFVDIGVKLFVMSSVLAYSEKLLETSQNKKVIQNLANAYCIKAKLEIKQHFWNISNIKHINKADLKVSKDMLSNEFNWLENANVY